VKIPLYKSFLGQAYKAWAKSKDPLAADKSRRATLYGVYNDLGDDLTERLHAWDKEGFPNK